MPHETSDEAYERERQEEIDREAGLIPTSVDDGAAHQEAVARELTRLEEELNRESFPEFIRQSTRCAVCAAWTHKAFATYCDACERAQP